MKKPIKRTSGKLSQKQLLAAEARMLAKRREKTGRAKIQGREVTFTLSEHLIFDNPRAVIPKPKVDLGGSKSKGAPPTCGIASKVPTPIEGVAFNIKTPQKDGIIIAEHANGNGGYDPRMLRRYGFQVNDRKQTTLYRGQLPFVGSCERTIEMPRHGKSSHPDYLNQNPHMSHSGDVFSGRPMQAELKRIFQSSYDAFIDAEGRRLAKDADFHSRMLEAAATMREIEAEQQEIAAEQKRLRKELRELKRAEKAQQKRTKGHKQPIARAHTGDLRSSLLQVVTATTRRTKAIQKTNDTRRQKDAKRRTDKRKTELKNSLQERFKQARQRKFDSLLALLKEKTA